MIKYSKLIVLSILIPFLGCGTTALTVQQKEDNIQAIKTVLFAQQDAWNEGNIDKFMEGYWKNDLMSFTGKSGVTKGWQNTLNRYNKSYPDTDAMGQLSFEIIDIRIISSTTALMQGKFTLQRTNDQPSGYFTLLWEKVNKKWVITSDHTSG